MPTATPATYPVAEQDSRRVVRSRLRYGWSSIRLGFSDRWKWITSGAANRYPRRIRLWALMSPHLELSWHWASGIDIPVRNVAER
jgi:hypothetical protein